MLPVSWRIQRLLLFLLSRRYAGLFLGICFMFSLEALLSYKYTSNLPFAFVKMKNRAQVLLGISSSRSENGSTVSLLAHFCGGEQKHHKSEKRSHEIRRHENGISVLNVNPGSGQGDRYFGFIIRFVEIDARVGAGIAAGLFLNTPERSNGARV